ncbi:MAG TPA: hypothetical protein VLQ89_05540, partial [Candidatus Binatia bacterium]|nr:hypothetical protein [Candidatus Binatia bacterium]
MTSDMNHRLYRSVKWLWLLLQALILPLAAVFAAAVPGSRWPLILPAPLLVLIGTAFLVLWLIAQSLLAMARFPLTLNGALLLVGGTIAQLAFLTAAGGSLTRAAYSVFFATLAALAAIAFILAGVALLRRSGTAAARLAFLLAQLPAAALVWFMITPLRPTYSNLSWGTERLEWLALAANAALIAFSLYRFSIF